MVRVDPSFIRFALRMVGSREGREIVRAKGEFERYVAWRMRKVLEESKLDRELEVKPFHEFVDQTLARMVCDFMVESGYAVWLGDRLRFTKPAGEAPAVRTRIMGEFKTVVDRVLASLPEALLTGMRLYAASAASGEIRAAFAKLLDSMGYNWFREYAVRWARIPPNSTVLDVGAGIGLSSIAILRVVPGSRVIAVDPHKENLEAAKLYAEILGLADRLETRVGRGEEVDKLVDAADWAVVINVLHWCADPLVLLQAVGRVAPRLLLAQGVSDKRVNLAGAFITYLLGSGPFPTRRRLYEMLRLAGWKVERRTEFPAPIVVASRGGSIEGG
ncbi:MAG: class I SAM-dependent methyltransferase [Thermofilaceae archaeon]